jgi:hypothetical protein
MNLLTYKDPVRPSDLAQILSGEMEPPTSPTGIDKPLEHVVEKAAEIVDQVPRDTDRDAKLAPILYEALKDTPRRILTSQLFWHWMTTSPLRDFVNHRWTPDVEGMHKPERYLGTPTLNGVNRNGLARLYWTADATVEDGSYDLTEKVLTNADLHLGIFDRLLCLDNRLVKTCIRLLDDVGQDVHRKALLLLRIRLRTTVVEALDDTQVEALMAECLTLAE